MLTIIIPTFNRAKYLRKNIEMLDSFIVNNELESSVKILVSNNCSTDDTQNCLEFLKNKIKSELIVYNQVRNIGLEKNALFVLGKSTTKYVMYMGDDDFLEENYLLTVISEIAKDDSLGCIIPSFLTIDYDGNTIYPLNGRDLELPTKYYGRGFENALENSDKGHQLSGLVFKRDGLLESYNKEGVNNIYLFIYFTAYSCLNYSTLHLTSFPIRVTAALQKDKDWGYGNDGLIPEIFDNYCKLPNISFYKKYLLQKELLIKQSWRYFMYSQHGKIKFLKSLFIIISSKNTNWLTKFFFPFYICWYYINGLVRKLKIRLLSVSK